MNEGCSTLTCGSGQMSVAFGEDLFGVGPNGHPANWASEAKPTWQDDGSDEFKIDATLGTNGMTYSMNEETDTITFKMFIALAGEDQRKRSNVVGRQIDLGSLAVYTTPFDLGVLYECTYPLMVTLTSQDIQVSNVESFGSNVGYGNFAQSFAMNLDGAEGQNGRFVIGAPLEVKVEWSITTLPGLAFAFLDCGVSHGPVTAMIIKDGCYAAITETQPTGRTSTTAGFSYNVFKAQGDDSQDQTIICGIKICKVGKCGMPTMNSQCPAEAGDVPYKYQAFNV